VSSFFVGARERKIFEVCKKTKNKTKMKKQKQNTKSKNQTGKKMGEEFAQVALESRKKKEKRRWNCGRGVAIVFFP